MVMRKHLCKILFVAAIVILAMRCGQAYAGLPPAEYTDDVNNIALYHLNQSSGTIVADDNSSGRIAHDGTINAPPSPMWAAGAFGNGLNNADAGVCGTTAFNSSVSLLGSTFKMDISFKRDAINDQAHLFNIPAYFFLTAGVGGDDLIRAGINTSSGFIVAASELLDQANWNYATITVDGSSGSTQITLYLNGIFAASATGGALNPAAGDAPLYFGSRNDTSDLGAFVGTIDEVRIAKYAPPPPPPLECGDHGYQSADLNRDCSVNMSDFAEMAKQWMTCTDPGNPECI